MHKAILVSFFFLKKNQFGSVRGYHPNPSWIKIKVRLQTLFQFSLYKIIITIIIKKGLFNHDWFGLFVTYNQVNSLSCLKIFHIFKLMIPSYYLTKIKFLKLERQTFIFMEKF